MVSILVIMGIYAIFFAKPAPKDYDLEYDNQNGTITVTLDKALSDGTWQAEVVSIDTSEGGHHEETICKNVPVTVSGDRLKITVTDSHLVNLSNTSYVLSITNGGSTMEFEFSVNNHTMTDSERVTVILFVFIIAGCFAMGILRRIMRGHW